MRTAIVATAAFFLIAGAAAAAPVTTVSTAKGDVLAGENGMTLYTFKNDKKGVSNCNGGCARNWPPLTAADGDKAKGPYSVIERKDGTYQWAKNGMPLYFWIKDAKKGDTTGDGVNGVWDIARP
jgi:predicted lipoprotein with Yx(FWY)xxD motif